MVIYLKPTGSELVQQTVFAIPGLRHEFEVIRLWEVPMADLLPFPGLLPLAILSRTDDQIQALREIAQRITSLPTPAAQSNPAAGTAILAGLVLEKAINGTGMELFDHHLDILTQTEAPLAARMRPRSLDEFVGQEAIIGPGRLLRRAIQADQLSSLIFYGPPGTGKTTLAEIIARTTQAHFIAINAVLAGVKDIREAITTAQDRRKLYQQRTILFVDEVHRFNKSQQDALLPWVENGTVILIGATTENPYFEVNSALVSRSRLFQLKPLTPEDLQQVVQHALRDPQRGYGHWQVQLEPAALEHLVRVANGDARAALNALELAVLTTAPDSEGIIPITLTIAEESIQRRAVLYDKEGDAHFDTISAFIKSLRGSDPDAALYWLARMIYAGEDPRFILRRMLILASEDVGMADPQAVVVVNACAAACDRVGMPEGRYPLAQAALYLATCPKSNSTMGFFDALAAVEQEQQGDVPLHLRDAHRDKQGFGHGAGYLYPHAYREHWVAQQYLPNRLQGQVFYQPSHQGYEAQIQQQVARQREAQLAAMVEGLGGVSPGSLTVGWVRDPGEAALQTLQERWRERTLGQLGQRLARIRDRLFELAQLQRHELVLDWQAGNGLLTWEALRRVPEGGVYACVQTAQDQQALTEAALMLPPLLRPILVQTDGQHLAPALDADLRFDCVLGRNVLMAVVDKVAMLEQLQDYLHPRGRVVLAEAVPRQAQRLYRLIEPDRLGATLYRKLVAAEEAIYTQTQDARVNWDGADLEAMLTQAGWRVECWEEPLSTEVLITAGLIQNWFRCPQQPPSYADHLAQHVGDRDLKKVRQAFVAHLCDRTVPWESHWLFLRLTRF